jgi:hypothetical protein
MSIKNYECKENKIVEIKNIEENNLILPNETTRYCVSYKQINTCSEVLQKCCDSSLVYTSYEDALKNINKNSNVYIYKIVCSNNPDRPERSISEPEI